MVKAKSIKLRIFITLQALTKHADKNHGLNSLTLNEYLRPYGLDCSNKYFRNTIKALREFGVDVKRKNGVWINNRPLTDERLQILAFALSTNPYITKEQAEEVLEGVKPFITIYQEELLNNYVSLSATNVSDNSLYTNYSVIKKALLNNAQIKFTTFNSERIPQNKYTVFTPKSICQNKNGLYLIGSNHSTNRSEKVALKAIYNVKLVKTRKNRNS